MGGLVGMLPAVAVVMVERRVGVNVQYVEYVGEQGWRSEKGWKG